MPQSLPLPPSPRGWPLLGHLPRLRSEGMLSVLDDSWRTLGDIFSVDIGMHAVVVAHPDGIKRILAGNAKN